MKAATAFRLRELIQPLSKPGTFLAALYALAICFERSVDVDIFKPFRVVGAVLILFVVIKARITFNRFALLAAAYVLTGFILALATSAARSTPTPGLFVSAALWAFNVAMFVALFNTLKQPRDIVVVALVHAIGILLAAHGIALEANSEVAQFGASGRVYGDFRNPANACVSMLFSALVLLAAVRAMNRPRHPIGRVVGLALITAAVGYLVYAASLTGSRAGAAVVVAGLMIYFVMSQSKRAALAFGLVVALALASEFVAPGAIERTVSEVSGQSVLAKRVQKKGLDTDRLYLWRSGFDAFVDTYGLGLGMSTYPTVHRKYFAQYASRSDPRWMQSDLTLHNDAVSALVEFGLVGLCLFISMWLELARAARKVASRSIRPLSYALLIGMAINGLSHTGLADFSAWFYFALLFAWVRCERLNSIPGAASGCSNVPRIDTRRGPGTSLPSAPVPLPVAEAQRAMSETSEADAFSPRADAPDVAARPGHE